MSLKTALLVLASVATLSASTAQSFALDRMSLTAIRVSNGLGPRALNPQPLPPRWTLSRFGSRTNPAALNPQPLPPLERPLFR